MLCESIILIGGSAGSFPAIEYILQNLPQTFSAGIIITLHRPKNIPSEMAYVLSQTGRHRVTEPEDKIAIVAGSILLAPQNYHLLAEEDGTLSLDYSEAELYSRPSINITFESFASVYKERVTAFILSGLNNDGADGLSKVLQTGGQAFIQTPEECEFSVMPLAAKSQNPAASYKTSQQIIEIIQQVIKPKL